MAIRIEEAKERLHHLLRAGNQTELVRFLETIQPPDLAELVMALSEPYRREILSILDHDLAARTLECMTYDAQRQVILSLPRPLASAILERMSSDDLADLLGELGTHHVEEILQLIPEDADEIRGLMQYPENTAGGLMTLDVIATRDDATVEQTLAYLRKQAPDSETAYYVYVTNGGGRLVGVVSLRQLVVAEPHVLIRDIQSTNVISVPVLMDQEEVARLFEKYDLLALPVVDEDRRLLGVVTVDDVIDVIHEETTRDIARMGGQEPLDEPYLSARVFRMVRKRVGWLLILFAAQSITVNIIAHYEQLIAQVALLAAFMPLLTGTGGNAGAQSATLVVRAMAVGDVRYRDLLRVVCRELLVGIILGAVMAGIAYGWSILFRGEAEVRYTVALTVFAVIVLASVLGAGLPMIARRLGFDPAVASSPLITTVADATGLIIYFTVASHILGL